MSTHVPADATARQLLDDDAIAKALSRIAHEIIERTDDLESVALVGIQSRGAPLASRLRRLVEERSGVSSRRRTGITFHRRSTSATAAGPDGNRSFAPRASRFRSRG
jgi:pyrimidine operon attenuation protein/uracil phosphoribosyltransferase